MIIGGSARQGALSSASIPIITVTYRARDAAPITPRVRIFPEVAYPFASDGDLS